MSATSSGPESSNVELVDWTARFRRVQLLGGELAAASGIEVEEIPDFIKEERRSAKPENLE